MLLVIVGPTHPYKGGVAQHTTLLAHRLADAGHEVEVWSWSAQYPKRLYPGQLRVVRPEVPPFPETAYPLSWSRPKSWWRTGRRLRRRGYDAVLVVVVTPIQAPAYLAMLRATRRRLRTVCIVHNVLPHEPRRFDRPLVTRLLGRADHLVVHSDAEAKAARELVPTPAVVCPLPPLALTATGPAHAVADVHNRILFFGIVRHYKGLDVLLRALALGPEDLRLVVAGEFWDDAAGAKTLIGELGLGGRVELREGYVDAAEVPALLAGVDALVLPYRTATASAHPAIAFSHGLPVVATDVGNLAEQVRDGVDGLVVPPEDPVALAAALTRLYEPGVLDGLRSGVRPVDDSGAWQAYVRAVEAALGVG